MVRQGAALAAPLDPALGPPVAPASVRILDAASGIGTQALALAARGFRVTARDISHGAIARLRREATARGLDLDVAVAGMRAGAPTRSASFDAVLAFRHSVPHLLCDPRIPL